MNQQEIKEKLKGALQAAIKDEFKSNSEILMISLCTTDGFHIHSERTDAFDLEETKMSAMSSTLFSLSKACAEIQKGNTLNIATVETENTHFFFLKTDILNLNCVLSFAVHSKLSLAQGRFHAKRLSEKLGNLPKEVIPG